LKNLTNFESSSKNELISIAQSPYKLITFPVAMRLAGALVGGLLLVKICLSLSERWLHTTTDYVTIGFVILFPIALNIAFLNIRTAALTELMRREIEI
jgi:hypothetical protein